MDKSSYATLRTPHYSSSPPPPPSTQSVKPGVSLWRKSRTLFRHLDLSFPRHRLFLKIDVDCLIVPNSLLQYLRYLDEAAPEGPVRAC